MKILYTLFLATLIPLPCAAQEVSFLIEQVYATSEIQVEERDISELTGAAARRYREQLRLQNEREAEEAASSSDGVLEETVDSPEMEVQESSESSQVIESSESSASEPAEPYYEPAPAEKPYTPPPAVDQEEQDELTLEQLEEYANEASENIEELIEALEEGFVITSTSSLGSPLPTAQRSAILRRTVRTVGQLKLFARALAESDAQLRKIEVIEDSVVVSYRRKAYIFGFIPLNYIIETSVTDDTVTVEKPWWLLLSRHDIDEHIDTLQQDIENLEPVDDGVPGLLSRMQSILEAMSGVAKQE
ncbi:MAG: hypothetical protein HOG89_01650 [Candidatus Peribacter sp.]|nr:hypothetical protein [Candidatus Peribacter sp.]MBT5937481.1 hypothetical protein [Candidatus Peribacter sp.]MBT7761318.1 hypothetical protein [Candidatus Peribacter sp.]